MEESLTLKINRINHFGVGICHSEEAEYYIPGTLIGEIVKAKIINVKGKKLFCELLEIVEKSPKRVEPRCFYYGECGGCDFQHISYDEQLRIKEEYIKNLFQNEIASINKIIKSPLEYNYRNRIRLHKKENHIGYNKKNSKEIIAIERCELASELVNEKIRDYENIPLLNGEQIQIREDEYKSFIQVNTEQNKNLIKTVCDFLKGKKYKNILELYSGQGNLTIPLLEFTKKLIAVEGDKESVEILSKIKAEKKIKKLQTVQSHVYSFVYQLKEDLKRFEVIVCDPPREGLKETVEILPSLNPEKIIYVSCDPKKFIKDYQKLKNKNYFLKALQPIDMFPQTHHIELVALLEKS